TAHVVGVMLDELVHRRALVADGHRQDLGARIFSGLLHLRDSGGPRPRGSGIRETYLSQLAADAQVTSRADRNRALTYVLRTLAPAFRPCALPPRPSPLVSSQPAPC